MTITRTPKNSHKISQQQQQEKIQKIGASEKDRQKRETAHHAQLLSISPLLENEWKKTGRSKQRLS